MLLLPLRTAPATAELGAELGRWLDAAHRSGDNSNIPEFSTCEIREDLQRLDRMRSQIFSVITTSDAHKAAMDANVGSLMKEYHACLLECEKRGFPSLTAEPNGQQQNGTTSRPGGGTLRLEWTGCFLGDAQHATTLSEERAALLWNLAALESYQASAAKPNDKRALSKSVKQWQAAASYLSHLSQILLQQHDNTPNNSTAVSLDFSIPMRTFWEKVLLGQGQIAGYEMAGATAKPRHLLLAKLATAVVPLLNEALDACRSMQALHGGGSSFSERNQEWITYLQATSALYAAKAEHHESITHKDKSKWGMEMARLEKGLSLANHCQDLLEQNGRYSQSLPALSAIQSKLQTLLETLTTRYQQAQQEHADVSIPPPNEVRDIRGELLTKGTTQPLPKDCLNMPPPPLFGQLLGGAARAACDSFRQDMDHLVKQMTQMVDAKTESAREQLASVNLPHSLTAYKQEQSGGGIPMELWERVDQIQKDRKIATLKRDLWGLRDLAEQASDIFERTRSQLEEDVTMDGLFRQQHQKFDGHDVREVQQSFRSSLQNYEKLLQKSQEGDSVLLRRLEILDTDPKYKLLQFQKSQLDRLLPSSSNSNSSSQQQPTIDTTHLSRLLVDLSKLFHDRDVTLSMLREEVKNYDIKSKVVDIDPNSPNADEEYKHAVAMAQKAFAGIAYEIQSKVNLQMELMHEIMVENERFVAARRDTGSGRGGRHGNSTSTSNSSSSAASDSCIAMIEDAIDEIQQLSRHLMDGRAFYDVVIPKLEALKQQVGDASVRLAVERCEYEDDQRHSEERRRQESEDAKFAKELNNANSSGNSNSNSNTGGDNNNNGNSQRQQHHTPGVVNVRNDEPHEGVRVDDQKVASLVAMDFDPDKVVAALKKYDNNVEQALNELLSC